MDRLVAVKVSVANQKNPDREREMLARLSDDSPPDLMNDYAMSLFDSFQHEGPNGNHQCLVLEILGQNVQTFQGSLLRRRLPLRSAKIIA